jgi:nitroreductase
MSAPNLLGAMKTILKGVVYYGYDLLRFYRASTALRLPEAREQWIATITIDYHRIEKGLALPNPRRDFGKDVAHRLVANTSKYIERFGYDEFTDIVASVLKEYLRFLSTNDVEHPAASNFVTSYAPDRATQRGGTRVVTRDEISTLRTRDAEGFFSSRHSIRQFSTEPIDPDLLTEAVGMARFTPSVCNRQGGRAYLATDPETIRYALSFQNGNAGYGDQASALFLITTEMSIFEKVDERNQGWIDGGLFAMSLGYALHALGLGACMLNWSVGSQRDYALRKAFEISDTECIIMMIAVGHLPETLRVAQSPRRPVGDFLRALKARV